MPNNILMERYRWFDRQIRDGKFPNASHLSVRFEISAKTAQRNIEFIRDRLMTPIEYDSVSRGYFYSDDSFTIPSIRMTEQELTALLLARKLLTSLNSTSIAKDLASIPAKLSAIIEKRTDISALEDSFSFEMVECSAPDSKIWNNVATALLRRRELDITYYSPSNNVTTKRVVAPYHLLNYMGNWHLIAYCRLRNSIRDFVLDRVSDAKMTEKDFSPPMPDEIAKHLSASFGIFKGQGKGRVAIRFNHFRARWIRSQKWHKDQEIVENPDGSIMLTLPVSHFAEIKMEILKFGADAEVMAPKELRDEVKKEIEKMKRVYEL